MMHSRKIPESAWDNQHEPETDFEVVPGMTVKARLPKDVPQYALIGLVQDPDGTHRVGQIIWSQWLPMGRDIPRQLGIPIHHHTLRRLMLIGAVEASQPAPGMLLMDATSLLRHLHRTRIRPGRPSWWTAERRALWRDSEIGNAKDIPAP
jgi:hypothetical protein